MNRKFVLVLTLTLLVGTLSVAFNVQRAKASGTIYIRADGSIDPPIALIYTADNVTYTLSGNITADADGIVIERDNIVLNGAGYTLQGTNPYESRGTNVTERSNVTISNMTIKAFYCGIYLYYSSNSIISGNNITANNNYGISLEYSSRNSISGNNITNNGDGIYLYSSSNNTMSRNKFINDGLLVSDSYQNSVENNTVDGKPLVYLEGASNYTVDDAGQVILVRCENIRVESLNLSRTYAGVELWETTNSTISGNKITANNWIGIFLYSSSGNIISGNNITDNYDDGIRLTNSLSNSIFGNNITKNGFGISLYSSSGNSISGNDITRNYDDSRLYYSSSGIYLYISSNNSISGNNVTANNDYGISLYSSLDNSISENNIANNYDGIYLTGSSNNSVYHNNFINNTRQVHFFPSGYANLWDYGSGGNYWSDYSGTDANHDGIGDTPYIIDGNNTDHYPLMTPYAIPEFPSFLILPLFMIATLLAVIAYRKKKILSNRSS